MNEFCLLDCWLVLLSAIFKKVVFELRQLVQHVILLVSDEKKGNVRTTVLLYIKKVPPPKIIIRFVQKLFAFPSKKCWSQFLSQFFKRSEKNKN